MTDEQLDLLGGGRDHPLARNTDPATSRLADTALRQREGRANEIRANTKRHLALECFILDGDLIPEDVVETTGEPGIWKRVSDLKRDGFIETTGRTRTSRQGRQAEIYTVTESGRAAYAALGRYRHA